MKIGPFKQQYSKVRADVLLQYNVGMGRVKTIVQDSLVQISYDQNFNNAEFYARNFAIFNDYGTVL